MHLDFNFMRFDIITIFPKAFSYINESIMWRAQNKGFAEVCVHDLRDYSKNKRKRVDDTPRSEERRVGKECRSRWSPYH